MSGREPKPWQQQLERGPMPPLERRQLVRAGFGAVATALLGCGPTAAPPRPPPAPTLPVITVARLTDLVPAAGLGWLVVLMPEQLLRLRWLKPSLSRVIRDERLDLLAKATGVDLRQVPELALSGHGADGVILQLARHRRDPLTLERLFRQRLTSDERRSVEAEEQLVRVSGRIGRQVRSFVAIGMDVVGFQYGGDAQRGPARIAQLVALGKLRRASSVRQDPILGPLWTELGPAPLRAVLTGPFEDDFALGARGLLQAATGLAAGATPTDRRSLSLAVLIGGDYSSDAAMASSLLETAWADLAESDLGHLLGLNRPRNAPRAAADGRRLRLDVDLDPTALFDGLAAATTDNIREIMRRVPSGA